MFTHVLVALDGSRRAESILPYVLDLAQHVSAEVTLVRVVAPNPAEASEWGALGKRRPSVAAPASGVVEAEKYLAAAAEGARRSGLTINLELREGDPATEILRTANEIGADTIAIATHARRGLDLLMFGSVAERVVHDTRLPVILLSAKG